MKPKKVDDEKMVFQRSYHAMGAQFNYSQADQMTSTYCRKDIDVDILICLNRRFGFHLWDHLDDVQFSDCCD